MQSETGAAALTNSATDITPRGKLDSRMDSSNEDACLLSSGSQVRALPGTPSSTHKKVVNSSQSSQKN